MKKIFTLFITSLFSLAVMAFDGSRLSISAVRNGQELKIEIDGRKFSMKDNSITLGYMDQGRHDVKIYRERKRNGYGFGRREIIYDNMVFLRRGFHMDITVNRFGKVLIDERRMDINDEWYNDDDEYYDNGGWNNGLGNVMNNREFNDMKDQLRKEWFENNRLNSAKFIIDKNNFTTSQVRELMLLFSFENNRLDLAKYAYRKTVDKQNFLQVNDALTFNSSREELVRFIRESRDTRDPRDYR
ncbi:MAG TPA: DUF4476 domain-containing protein [Chitinophagaceae bacterium]|nr:DUF4476 domain-containing protein [Chitinophagaceae bacterium]